ncbi:MAG: nitrile hydratase accessory protein [Pseudomonadota bacterium]
MDQPDDALAPYHPAFKEPWHAQALALAHSLVAEGILTSTDWASALGTALSQSKARGEPDTEETYYHSVLEALETVGPLDPMELALRKEAWAKAYQRTPHGSPVTLGS